MEPNRPAHSSPAATLILASRPRPKRMLIPIPKRPYIPSLLRTKESQLLFYRLSPPVQTETSAFFPFAFMMLRHGHDHDPMISGRRSLNVAKIINIKTIARPIRNPTSWARSDNGRPRTASIA